MTGSTATRRKPTEPPGTDTSRRSRSRVVRLLLVAVVASAAVSCVPGTTTPVDDGLGPAPTVSPTTLPSGALHYAAIRYGTGSGSYLDLYRPVGAGPFPLVVWFHGGTWTTGNRSELPSGLRDSLLAAGYAVATVDYRLVALQGLQVVNAWPAGLLDAKLAVKYLRTFAGPLALDADRVVTSGHSAGGHLAVMVALSRGAAGVSLAGGDPVVAGAFAFGAPIDIQLAMSQLPASLIANIPVRWLMGCGLDGNYCNTTRMEPATYLDAADPPVRLIFGGADPVVPAATAAPLQAKATTAGYLGLSTQSVPGLDHDTVSTSAPTSSYLDWLSDVL